MAISEAARQAARERTRERHEHFIKARIDWYTTVEGMDGEDAKWKAEQDLIDYAKPQDISFDDVELKQELPF